MEVIQYPMLTKNYANYTIGSDCYRTIPEICFPYGNKILLIGGKTGLEKGKPSLMRALSACDERMVLDTVIYGTECTTENIQRIYEEEESLHPDMVFAMGGGKAMDTGKAVAELLHVPVFTFPTIPSNCAAMSALSVTYHEDHSFDRFLFFERPAIHCFMDTDILCASPDMYFRAGLGDTAAKFFECHFSARGDALDFHSALGKAVSDLCWERIRTYGLEAMRQKHKKAAGSAFDECVLTIIVNTGLVSHLVEDCYNCAVAHSVCYGLELLPERDKSYLHGDLVAYGVLVQLAIDHDEETLLAVRKLFRELGLPVSLHMLGCDSLDYEKLKPFLRETLAGPDMEHIPYPIGEEMLYDAVCRIENTEGE